MPGLVDPDYVPYFSHPMSRVAYDFYHRQPYFLAGHPSPAGEVATYHLDWATLEALLLWAEELDPASVHAGFRDDALQTAKELMVLCDWRWYAWEALHPGVDVEFHGYAVLAKHMNGATVNVFETPSLNEAIETWRRLARSVADGSMGLDEFRPLVDDETFALLERLGRLPLKA